MRRVRALTTYLNLTPEERRIIHLALLLLVSTKLALRLTDAQSWRRRIARFSNGAGLPQAPADERNRVAARTARLVHGAARHVWPNPSCLHRSLVVQSLLQARGLDAQLRFGVRQRGAEFEAHAWVEYEGEPLTDPDDVHGPYTMMQGSEG